MADPLVRLSINKPEPPAIAVKKSIVRKILLNSSLLPQSVFIPAGCFQMGSAEQESGRNKDERLHRVCVKSFKLSKQEVTVEAFNKFVISTQFQTDAERDVEEFGCWSYEKDPENLWNWRTLTNWRHPLKDFAINAKHPVSCVSFNDVMAYIHWLNQSTGQEYRLPTEAEWEYAARAGTTTERYWGNNAAFACTYANVADNVKLDGLQWTEKHDCVDSHFFLAPIASFRANKFGLHDMLGNVSEWTCSAYQENYVGEESRCTDQANAKEQYISIRGGGWNANPARVRSAARNSDLAWSRQANLGFRLVRVR